MIILPQQPIATIAAIAAGAVTIILSGASIGNMYETYALTQRYNRQLQISSPEIDIDTTCWKVHEAVNRLASMKRKELKQLFLHCEPPGPSDMAYSDDGDWVYDGCK